MTVKLIRVETRPDITIPFYTSRSPYVKQMMQNLQIFRDEVLSPDMLSRTVTLSAPDHDNFEDFFGDTLVNQEIQKARDSYNAQFGITATVDVQNQ